MHTIWILCDATHETAAAMPSEDDNYPSSSFSVGGSEVRADAPEEGAQDKPAAAQA